MSATKVDFLRELSELYLPGRKPVLVEVPEMAFLMVDGHGDPSTAVAYGEAIEALYSVAYAIKFAVKRMPAGIDFTVMPLEGLWWTSDTDTLGTDKSAWKWTAMIMQPDRVTSEIVQQARTRAGATRSLPALERMRYERFTEGLAAQVMYFGPYKDEGPAIEAVHEFIADQGFIRAGKHHEIYLGDPRRTAPEKLRTVIRRPVARR